ncbi:polysaccharide pyruvyl transferase family protein [Geoalkalibacter sp.]|uniref:polysaccharide pyruvyl transferase family protein n=1 Tax=Geoalkalibacter sp. TaxID=3041440 RepID=UPI00272DEB5E|nr:polysaccharide pyruvyl transferase family protein [Geoalkalibacter sp.]
MKKILLMDTLSTIHVGNGALLENTIKLCRDAYGECEISIITMDRETNRLKYKDDTLFNAMFGSFWFGKGRLGKFLWAIKNSFFMLAHMVNENTLKIKSEKLTFTEDQKNAIRAIERADICVSCGGEIIGDTFFQALPFWLFTYWLAIKKGKVFILFPQTVGPLKMKWTRALVKMALANSNLFVGRDKASYETLLSLGFDPDKVMFVPDVAIQQVIGEADVHTYFSDNKKKVVGITISNPPQREMGGVVDFVEKIGEQVEQLDPEQFKILIMPSNYVRDGISSDYALCLKLKERLGRCFETEILENRPYFPGEFTGLLSQLEFFISTRMHVAILSTRAYVPTIAINTQHKIRGYMQNINMEHFCVDYSELSKLHYLIQQLTKDRDKIVENLKNNHEILVKKHDVFISRLKAF